MMILIYKFELSQNIINYYNVIIDNILLLMYFYGAYAVSAFFKASSGIGQPV